MHIAAVGWIYVVLMMAITEESVIAAIMTFFFYGVLPVSIIVYLAGTGTRKRRRQQEQLQAMQETTSRAERYAPSPLIYLIQIIVAIRPVTRSRR